MLKEEELDEIDPEHLELAKSFLSEENVQASGDTGKKVDFLRDRQCNDLEIAEALKLYGIALPDDIAKAVASDAAAKKTICEETKKQFDAEKKASKRKPKETQIDVNAEVIDKDGMEPGVSADGASGTEIELSAVVSPMHSSALHKSKDRDAQQQFLTEDSTAHIMLLEDKLGWRVCCGGCCSNSYIVPPCSHGCAYQPYFQLCCCITDSACCSPEASRESIPGACAISWLPFAPATYLYPKCACFPTLKALHDLGDEAAESKFGAKANMRMWGSCCCGSCCRTNLYCSGCKCVHVHGSVTCGCIGYDCALPCKRSVAPYICSLCCLTLTPKCHCCPKFGLLFPPEDTTEAIEGEI